MKVNLTSENKALTSILTDPHQIINLDANFLIPPDRGRLARRSFDFTTFKDKWLDPIFHAFPNLAIHEAVYEELVLPSVKSYTEAMLSSNPIRLILHKDSTLTETEKMHRDSIENRIYPLTKYDPLLDNKDDRGEVKSLAYIAVKGLLYFATHDSNAINLVEKAEKWSTGLDNVQAIKMYEVIYYMYAMNRSEKQSLKMLYKYLYHLTKHEKQTNPGWGHFLSGMEKIYHI